MSIHFLFFLKKKEKRREANPRIVFLDRVDPPIFSNSCAPIVHLFLLLMYYFELAYVKCMKKPQKSKLAITLDFQNMDWRHTLKGLPWKNFPLKLAKSVKNTSTGWTNSCFIKVAGWRSVNLLKISPPKGIFKGFQEQHFASVLQNRC